MLVCSRHVFQLSYPDENLEKFISNKVSIAVVSLFVDYERVIDCGEEPVEDALRAQFVFDLCERAQLLEAVQVQRRRFVTVCDRSDSYFLNDFEVRSNELPDFCLVFGLFDKLVQFPAFKVVGEAPIYNIIGVFLPVSEN